MSRPTAAPAPASHQDNVLIFEDAPEFQENAAPATVTPDQDVESKVRAAKETLQQLRQQQEEIERQAKALEELKFKQETFVAGKREMSDKFSRSLSSLEVGMEECRKHLECLTVTRDNYGQHLDIIKGLQPENWAPDQAEQELDNALALIEDAVEDYDRGQRRIAPFQNAKSAARQTLMPTESAAGNETGPAPSLGIQGDDLGHWFRRGLAFTLPLIATMILALVLAKLMF
jgi:vacuolar-type H+-ATPase subunit I/STV1